ncbi:hypothetical protein N0V90_003935 [Kalmusia sp. IMI 367209]|nr:hypothetical protein N0V90_003935 [Kalmusia sp. IMI 367209]
MAKGTIGFRQPAPLLYHDAFEVATRVVRAENCIGYKFKDKMVCVEALKMSGSNFPLYWQGTVADIAPNNRLALLGDRAMALAMCRFWWYSGKSTYVHAMLSRETESRRAMARIGKEIGLDEIILIVHEMPKPSSDQIAEAFEAIIGAVYLDSGYDLEAVTRVLEKLGLDRHKLLLEPDQNRQEIGQTSAVENVPKSRVAEAPRDEEIERLVEARATEAASLIAKLYRASESPSVTQTKANVTGDAKAANLGKTNEIMSITEILSITEIIPTKEIVSKDEPLGPAEVAFRQALLKKRFYLTEIRSLRIQLARDRDAKVVEGKTIILKKAILRLNRIEETLPKLQEAFEKEKIEWKPRAAGAENDTREEQRAEKSEKPGEEIRLGKEEDTIVVKKPKASRKPNSTQEPQAAKESKPVEELKSAGRLELVEDPTSAEAIRTNKAAEVPRSLCQTHPAPESANKNLPTGEIPKVESVAVDPSVKELEAQDSDNELSQADRNWWDQPPVEEVVKGLDQLKIMKGTTPRH